eukprot:TRINITY_DN106609_c0_g1_i1.p1 TRINITY_DN106609_c0_g1~~TRINITY_DN106609_c0_g1_i1.p1  ORF type:complete len:625 (-),score=119.53 TRINITY_DN106609_c0_g1_i1:56-1900(-)
MPALERRSTVSSEVQRVDLTDSEDEEESEESENESDQVAELELMRRNAKEDLTTSERGPETELMTEGAVFCFASGFLSLANLAAMGIEMDFKCRVGPCNVDESHWFIIGQVFTGIFVIETLIRLWVAGPRRFFKGDKFKEMFAVHALNVVDFVIVVFRALDFWILRPAGVESGLSLISGFRVMRVGPAVKHCRTSPTFRELWIVLGAVGEILKTLFWVGVLMILVILLFAILVTQRMLEGTDEDFNYRRSAFRFSDYWGTVPRSAYSLFQVITRDGWLSSMVQPLVFDDPWLFGLFGLFFAIGSMALSNTIVGVVVECTMGAAKVSTDLQNQEKKRLDEMVMQSLRQIFREADTDGSGSLDMDELHEIISKYQVRDRLKLLQIPFADLDLLFTLLDVDGNGTVNTDMFFRGCAKLRGPAMACDLHQLSIDLNTNLERLDENADQLRGVNHTLGTVLDQVDEMDACILKNEDQDTKDPVLTCRQGRTRVSKADTVRGRYVVPAARNEQNMWMDLDRMSSKGSSTSGSQVAGNRAKVAAVTAVAQKMKASNQVRAVEDKKRKVVRAPIKNQPAPPPMPAHLKHLEAYHKARRMPIEDLDVKKKKGTRQRKQHSFDE